ncbi:hypothetical protein C8F01DRAFT_1076845 [Mycena amicta]|nr:hypothetical protein C8F01DRAFT_1076845 [Mycena amicta]
MAPERVTSPPGVLAGFSLEPLTERVVVRQRSAICHDDEAHLNAVRDDEHANLSNRSHIWRRPHNVLSLFSVTSVEGSQGACVRGSRRRGLRAVRSGLGSRLGLRNASADYWYASRLGGASAAGSKSGRCIGSTGSSDRAAVDAVWLPPCIGSGHADTSSGIPHSLLQLGVALVLASRKRGKDGIAAGGQGRSGGSASHAPSAFVLWESGRGLKSGRGVTVRWMVDGCMPDRGHIAALWWE